MKKVFTEVSEYNTSLDRIEKWLEEQVGDSEKIVIIEVLDE